MADNTNMALPALVRKKRGQRGGPLCYQFVPAVAKGPRHPQGRSELVSGAGRAAALTGNEAVGGSQTEERSPVIHLSFLTGTCCACFFFGCQDRKEKRTDG
jgi:hypothetical protein